jgi:hypothetical protein
VQHVQRNLVCQRSDRLPCSTHHTQGRPDFRFFLRLCHAVLCCAMQEEQAKRAARAKKFGLPEERQAPLHYAPDPEDQKRAARAKKFGSTYEQPSADTLLQKAGACRNVQQTVHGLLAGFPGCELAALEPLSLPNPQLMKTVAAG